MQIIIQTCRKGIILVYHTNIIIRI